MSQRTKDGEEQSAASGHHVRSLKAREEPIANRSKVRQERWMYPIAPEDAVGGP
jgi:hypothetical protein